MVKIRCYGDDVKSQTDMKYIFIIKIKYKNNRGSKFKEPRLLFLLFKIQPKYKRAIPKIK